MKTTTVNGYQVPTYTIGKLSRPVVEEIVSGLVRTATAFGCAEAIQKILLDNSFWERYVKQFTFLKYC